MSCLTIYRDDYSDATIVSNQFIDEYMENANDAQIKVYLYLLRMMHANLPTSISDIADKFNHTEKDVVRALSYWEKKNLVRIEYDENGEILALHMQSGTSSTPTAPTGSKESYTEVSQPQAVKKAPASHIQPAKSRPSYSLDEVASFQQDEEASQIIFIAEQYLGRVLTVPDIKTIIFLYKGLHFSTDLIDYLIEYCVGKGHRDMRYIEKVAINWSEEKITTDQQAKQQSYKYNKIVYTVMNALGRTSAPTAKEADFVNRWEKEYGFTHDMILAACEKAALAVDKNRIEYTDGILKSWLKQNIHNLSEAEAASKAFSQKKQTTTAKPSSFHDFKQRKYDYDALEKELLSN